MAENKKSFLLYCDLIHTVEQMPDELAGELFKHILSYVNDKNPVSESLILNLTFEPIKQSLKRDLKKYESIVERNKVNGTKGGRPRTQNNPTEPKKPTGLFGNPTEPKKADSDIDSDSVIVKDINNKISPEVKKLRGSCKDYFLNYYLEKKGSQYYWEAKDATNLNKLIAKVKFKVEEKNGTNYTNEDIFIGFKLILENINDSWVLENISIPTINSKFNEIFTKITNGKSTKDKYAGSQFRTK